MAPKLLNILLQRNDRNVQWGFRLSGGKDLAKPLTIVKVSPGTLAAQYLVPGDIVLNIQGYETKNLLHLEAVELVRDPGKSLELLIQKTDTPLSSNEDLPASIWGPEHVLQRPSEWIRRSPSPCMNQYFQPIAPKPSVYQRSVSVGSGYSEPSTSAIPMSPVLQTPSDWLRQSPTSFSTVFSEPTSPTEPIIQAPSPWMRRAPSPSPAVFHDHKPTKPTGYRNASSLRQHFEAVNQEAMQQESTFRTGYTPTSLDNKIKKKFETFGTESGFQKLNSVTEENFRPLFNPPARNWRASSEPCQKPFEAQKSYDASNVSYFSETKQYGHYQGSKFQAEMSKDVFKPQSNVRMYSRLSPTPVQEIIGPNRHQIQVQYEVQFGIQKQTQDRSYEHEIYQQQMKQREMEKEFQLKQQQQMQQQIQKQQQEQLRQQQQQEQLKQEQQQKLIQQQQLQQQQLLQQERLQQLQQHKVGAHYQTEKTKGQVQKANTISTTIVRSSREQFSASSVEVNKNIPSTEKPKIPSTADILKRPISPEFNMVPNSRSNSLLKHVLSKSLGSYSPADFEKMKAYENEQSDNEDDDEGDDSSTETDDDEDDDDDSTEAETEVETQDDDACSSCQPSVYDSGSVIFERFWGSENEDNDCAEDNEVMQHCGNSPFVELSTDTSCSTVASRRDTPTSISRNSSVASNYSRPDTPIVTEDLVDEYDRLRRSSSNVSSRPGTPVAQHSSRSSRCSSAASVDSRPGTPYTPLSRSSSTSSIPSRPGTPTVTDNLGG